MWLGVVAGRIAQEDIRVTSYNITEYEVVKNFMREANDLLVPTLSEFFDTVIVGGKTDTEIFQKNLIAIEQAITAAKRHRLFLSCLLLFLAVFLSRKVAPKTIVHEVAAFSFCSSNKNVTILKTSAVKFWKPDLDVNSILQFIFKNTDWNIKILTGKGTEKSSNRLSAIQTSEAPAPASFINLIVCSCKTGYGKRRGCGKPGLRCSVMCPNCHGQRCPNAEEEIIDEKDIIKDDVRTLLRTEYSFRK